jgi:BirA family biotin operon repressor/biotin-[acetyl-CoA-carboxylase] ligase
VKEQVERLLQTQIIGRPLVFREEVDSTNTLAKELADAGATHGTLVFAGQQTAGRGRRGRSWLGLPGQQVFLSIILRPALPVSRVFELTLTAAVALADAFSDLGVTPEIKWPNDIEVGGRKIAGILCESAIDGAGQLRYAILGVGANAEGALADIPPEIADRATSVEAVTGRSGQAPVLIAALSRRLEEWLQHSDLTPVLKAWKQRSTTLGSEVRVLVDGQTITGVAEDIDETGALLVREGSRRHRIIAGEVTSLRRKPA